MYEITDAVASEQNVIVTYLDAAGVEQKTTITYSATVDDVQTIISSVEAEKAQRKVELDALNAAAVKLADDIKVSIPTIKAAVLSEKMDVVEPLDK